MKRSLLTFITILSFCIITGTMFAFAESDPGFVIDNTRIVTNSPDATYIEGSVANACGQKIIVRKGFDVVAEKTMPDTGSAEPFRIRIPAGSIRESGVNVFSVKEKDMKDGRTGARERVEISCVRRETQDIKLSRKDYKLTYPGEGTRIDAKASSGEKLLYSSSDPKIAKVDSDGNITTSGAGKAVITVKQIGNGRYAEAEKKVNVSVKAIDAYTITYHSSDDENAVETQIVETGKEGSLRENSFVNGEHEFLGWARTDTGLVEFTDGEEINELAKTGDNVDLYAVWTGDGARAAVAWAIKIANDDSFTYGEKPDANNIGCYFCGTNCGPVIHYKPDGYEKTYVCLTFVGAAYAHGAEDPEQYYACSHGKMPMHLNDATFDKFSCWEKIGNCSDLSIGDLEPGDVLIKWSDYDDNDGHACMYAGNDDIVESSGGGWDADSIALKKGEAADRLADYSSDSLNFVMRYVGANAE